ncbi:hypothetical protein CALCODRAFT_340542 [Calocera cornea HHB12733]|uniref:Uncharacterized protein n=1 Tax=Calocera cornea HHB12733 TaxID=1353952 RepID=A0A165EXL8_9BASI|nr:hypothetical protein CALCODRAFT_340542 [Calocera cornea HHB12733]
MTPDGPAPPATARHSPHHIASSCEAWPPTASTATAFPQPRSSVALSSATFLTACLLRADFGQAARHPAGLRTPAFGF